MGRLSDHSTRRRRRRQHAFLFALCTSLLPRANAFSFHYTAPTQCGPLTVTWSGGTAPYSLLITPLYNVPVNISIPTSAKGSYTTNLALANPEQFLLTMSDATGFGTGGTSGLLTVASAENGASCNTTTPNLEFTFTTPLSLQQCRRFVFNGWGAAPSPLSIIGLIPLGNSFVFNPPATPAAYNWTANIQEGTSVVFTMFDGAGDTLGATDLMTVGSSTDNSCINSDSPASTITSGPSSTQSAPAQSGSSGADNGGSSSSNGGIIGGAVAGGIVLLVALLGLLWFLMRRRRSRKDTPHISTHFGRKRLDTHVDMAAHDPEPSSATEQYEPVPFVLPPVSAGRTSEARTSEGGNYPPGSGSGHDTAAGAGASVAAAKRAEAYRNQFGGQTENTPARFVLHSDAGTVEDHVGGEEEEPETVELPPQYTSIGGKVARSPTYRERGHGTGAAAGTSGGGGGGGPSGPS